LRHVVFRIAQQAGTAAAISSAPYRADKCSIEFTYAKKFNFVTVSALPAPMQKVSRQTFM
jgi:hypothetical protein